MTAPKRPTGAPVWYSREHTLSDEAKVTLADALGFPANAQDQKLFDALKRVEHWLGFYSGGVAAIDNAPSVSVYQRELRGVQKSAYALLAWLNSPENGINPFTRDTLNAHFEEAVSMTGPEDIANACSGVGNLLVACNSALNALEQEGLRETRGKKKAGSRDMVIQGLLFTFGKFNQSASDAKFEQFVRVALAEIGMTFENAEYGDGETALAKVIRRNKAPNK